MVSLIEQIKADREAGTPGPWRIGSHDPQRGIWVGGSNERGGAVLPYLYFGHTINFPLNYEANARRIARVPAMEAALIAADELADAVGFWTKAEEPDVSDAIYRLKRTLAAYRKATEAAQ